MVVLMLDDNLLSIFSMFAVLGAFQALIKAWLGASIDPANKVAGAEMTESEELIILDDLREAFRPLEERERKQLLNGTWKEE